MPPTSTRSTPKSPPRLHQAARSSGSQPPRSCEPAARFAHVVRAVSQVAVSETASRDRRNVSVPPIPGKPFGPGGAKAYGVQDACVANYNSIAAKLLGSKPNVVIADTYSAVLGVCGKGFTTCPLQHQGDVHPSGPGKQFLALEIAATVAPLLGRRNSRLL